MEYTKIIFSVVVDARNWSLDNFGEDLIATVLNGGTFVWDTSGGTSTEQQLYLMLLLL